ncbi:iron-containing alcohol dehydrogenase [Rhodopila sp.]|jgi:maleylacetate reductase|uniref:iron-containing alcohol dehydrogenase n=1 Tax=Rhodopila sp. TaxID=2480087 RepID=UPI002CB91AF4|nr:iron-containing alcohol dehydrogenase [Rhodopila sp.]HVZ10626.1 iron-containing alcohol dehydrogenase [Rhodopila sp.]
MAQRMVQGIHRYPPMERVVYGVELARALSDEIDRLGAKAVYVLASGTLTRETDVIDTARRILGNRMAGLCARIGAHTPRIDVVAAANEARAAKADLLLTIGGGSVTDAAKMVGLCLGNDVTTPEGLDRFKAIITADGKTERPPVKPPSIRSIDVPTTLSAGEFTAMAGCTDTVRHVKESYAHPLMMPQAVILDPAVTIHTPLWLFLSTGLRAVDHAVEDLCSINPTPFSDGMSMHALRLLAAGLPAVKRDPSDLAARLDCQLGAWMSIMGSQNGVTKGASHGIGHVLGGTAGVPHGYTSCVMLPHVLRFNAPVNATRQAWVSEALGWPGKPAADAVAALVASLDLPQTLREVGVTADQLDTIAEGSMHDRWVHTNPRKIDGPATVRMLLDAAW